MRAIRLITLPALFLLATSASASPSASVNWGSCPFPAGASTNRNMGSGPKETITVTAKGLSGPVQAGQVILRFAAPGGLPDAWRYDEAGCEAGRVSFENDAAADPCPPLVGANPRSIAKFEYDVLTQTGRLTYVQAFDVLNADPNVTYTIGRFTFDHSPPDPCGCLETPVCIAISYATYLDGAGNEIPYVIGQGYLTWNDPTNSSHCPNTGSCDLCITGACVPTPVHPGTWGSLKASYR